MSKLKHRLKILLLGKDFKRPFYTKEIFRSRKYVIGEHTYGEPNVLFENDDTNLTIGKFCSIADGVTIFLGGNHRVDWVSTYPFNALTNAWIGAEKVFGHPATKGNVNIGNDVWLGTRATIMSGVTIGDGAVIGAESVVTKDIGPYEIWAGNPAKFIRLRFSEDQVKDLLQIAWWNWTDEKIRNHMEQLCSNNISEFINAVKKL